MVNSFECGDAILAAGCVEGRADLAFKDGATAFACGVVSELFALYLLVLAVG
jgi:hypothetical protein